MAHFKWASNNSQFLGRTSMSESIDDYSTGTSQKYRKFFLFEIFFRRFQTFFEILFLKIGHSLSLPKGYILNGKNIALSR